MHKTTVNRLEAKGTSRMKSPLKTHPASRIGLRLPQRVQIRSLANETRAPTTSASPCCEPVMSEITTGSSVNFFSVKVSPSTLTNWVIVTAVQGSRAIATHVQGTRACWVRTFILLYRAAKTVIRLRQQTLEMELRCTTPQFLGRVPGTSAFKKGQPNRLAHAHSGIAGHARGTLRHETPLLFSAFLGQRRPLVPCQIDQQLELPRR